MRTPILTDTQVTHTTEFYEYVLELLKCFKNKESPGNDGLNKELFKVTPRSYKFSSLRSP